MNIFGKKKDVNLEEERDIADDIIESDFVPYACHYNPNTILTKNGELLQTIKIVGFAYEHISNDTMSLRETLRKAIHDNVDSNKYAIWIHTIRRKSDFSPSGEYPDEFSRMVNEQWKKKNDWGNKFTNELYISIAVDGQTINLKNPKDFIRGFFDGIGFSFDRRARQKFLNQSFEKLDTVVSGMLRTLESYGARRLGVYEKEGVFYSEMLNFLGKIINLKEVDMPIPDMDLSRYLPQQDVTFGYNAMEVRTHDGRRRFGSIITVKEYKELSLNAIDYFLQIPMEFVISQCITFLNNEKALEQYEYQKFLMDSSGDKDLAKLSGLEDIMNSNMGRPTDYGEQQLTIFLLSDDLRHLEKFTGKSLHVLASFGIVGIREDIKFEECYWALLPGNFEFLKRLKPINTSRIGGFANLSNFPAGKAEGNHWGAAVSVMYTAAKTPYFFNFHSEDNGHTTVIGKPGTGKTVLINFLLCQSRKYNGKIFFLDQKNAARKFLEKIGGSYFQISKEAGAGRGNNLRLNPLSLPGSPENMNFLYFWLLSMLHDISKPFDKSHEALIRASIAHVYTLPETERNLRSLKSHLDGGNAELAARLADWVEGGKYAYVFTDARDSLDTGASVIGINLDEIQKDRCHVPVLYYLLHRINYALDGAPAIIVIDEAWTLLDNHLLGPSIGMWLDMLRAKNAIAVLATSDVETAATSRISESIKTKIASQIYLPDADPTEVYQNAFGLTEKEVMFLSMMEVDERHFLLKRNNDTIVVELNLDGLDDVVSVLSKSSAATATAVASVKQAEEESALPVFGAFLPPEAS